MNARTWAKNTNWGLVVFCSFTIYCLVRLYFWSASLDNVEAAQGGAIFCLIAALAFAAPVFWELLVKHHPEKS